MSRNVQSLERGLAVLEVLVRNGPSGVTEVAAQLELDKTVVHRLLNTLQSMQYVKQDANRKYLVGARLRMIASKVLSELDLRALALPYMRHLVDHTKGVAHLAIIAESRAVYIERVIHSEFNIPSTDIGGEAPGYCSAAGKVLWAYMAQRELNELLENVQFRNHTTNTITDRQDLQRHLAQIHQQGYAVDNEEHRLGLLGIGAPVQDYTGNVIASICVAADSSEPHILQSTRDLVLMVAQELSNEMGYMHDQL